MIVVEDGSGVVGAEAYTDAAGVQAYWTSHGFVAAFSTDQIEQAIRRATVALEGRYRTRWPGRPTNALGVRQALAWPRTCVTDVYGFRLADNDIPGELIAATAEFAAREVVAPGALSPDDTTKRILSESVANAISVTYANMGNETPVVTVVDDILSGLVRRVSFGFLMRG